MIWGTIAKILRRARYGGASRACPGVRFLEGCRRPRLSRRDEIQLEVRIVPTCDDCVS